MDILESVKAVFARSAEKIAVCDEKLRPLWRNTDEIPEILRLDDFDTKPLNEPVLPILTETVLRHRSGCAAVISPLYDGEELAGYMLRFVDPETLEVMVCRSDKRKELPGLAGRIRETMSELLLSFGSNNGEPGGADKEQTVDIATVKRVMMGVYSALVNYEESARLYGGTARAEVIDGSDTLKIMLGSYERFTDNPGLRIVKRIEDGICIKTVRDMLELIVLNLIVNVSLYADAEDKEAVIGLRREDGYAVLWVSDNGRSADLERIERLSHYNNRYPDSSESMALALARKFAEDSGGSIAFERSETGGLCVSLRFPEDEVQFGTMRSTAVPRMIMEFDRGFSVLAKAFDPSLTEDRLGK
ncbi:MAG: HAMP domain-containing histidine kinase [Ruminococcus sp.]|nr:HAMP domain-containing histidine kinase [Ruminococcus sp.]